MNKVIIDIMDILKYESLTVSRVGSEYFCHFKGSYQPNVKGNTMEELETNCVIMLLSRLENYKEILYHDIEKTEILLRAAGDLLKNK